MTAQKKKHQLTKYATENKWYGDLFTNGENLTPPSDFKVTTLENSLLSQQGVTIFMNKTFLHTCATFDAP